MHTTTQQHRVKAARHIVVGLLFVFMAIAPALAFAAGTLGADRQDGSKNNPFTISNADELAYLAELVNTEATSVNLPDGISAIISPGFQNSYIQLAADIDLSGRNWTPIGNSPSNSFRGSFDGNGHVVKGLKIDIRNLSGYNNYVGLFGYVSGGEIRNLGVRLAGEGINVEGSGYVYVGGIAGSSLDRTTIRNCYMDAEKGGKIVVKVRTSTIGGITSELASNAMITNCYSTVDLEGECNVPNNISSVSYIGGIVGSSEGTISHTYATGSIKVTGNAINNNASCDLSVGGICGYNNGGTIENNLALNKEVNGKVEGSGRGSSFVNRIVGQGSSNVANNYASPKTTVNGNPASGGTTDNENGADTWLDTFKDDLLKEPATNNGWGEGNGWKWPAATSTLLPKLDMVRPDGALSQLDIDARDYLDACPYPRLHIQSPAGITLTVTDPNNRPIADNKPVFPGTRLKLSHTITLDGYSFNHYLWGTSAGQVDQPVSGETHDMPSHDLWISASVSYTKPTPVDPPYVPVYYTVTLPEVEGATTDPVAGSYEVEAWDTFRFYLMLDTAYDHSQPVVTTSRNEVLTPRKSDGAYLVKYVRSDVEIRIDSIRPNSPVGNEAIEAAGAPVVRAEGSIVFITVPRATEALLCDLSGRLVRTLSLPSGETRVEGLHPGIYLIKLPGYAGAKVVVKR